MRFFIKFLEILTIVVGYGTISFLAFELLKVLAYVLFNLGSHWAGGHLHLCFSCFLGLPYGEQ
jgi:hypothetical protein